MKGHYVEKYSLSTLTYVQLKCCDTLLEYFYYMKLLHYFYLTADFMKQVKMCLLNVRLSGPAQ